MHLMPSTDGNKPPASMASATIYLVGRSTDRLYEGRRLAAQAISQCEADTSKAIRGIHPDILELSAPEGKERIGIAQVRELIRAAQFAAVQSSCKICLIAAAEALTVEASNALLKILEEPPRGLRFILLTEHPADLLPTIVSRSRLIRIPAASQTQITTRLRDAGYEPDRAEWISHLPLRTGEVDFFLTSVIDVPQALDEASRMLSHGDIAAVIDACVSDNPLLRRQGLLFVLKRMASSDAELVTAGVRILAAQSRETLSQFLHALLMTTFDLVRASQRNALSMDAMATDVVEALGAKRLTDLTFALDDAHRCMAVYGPIEGILLSLFLPFEGEMP